MLEDAQDCCPGVRLAEGEAAGVEGLEARRGKDECFGWGVGEVDVVECEGVEVGELEGGGECQGPVVGVDGEGFEGWLSVC